MTRIIQAQARRDTWLRRARRTRSSWLRRVYGEYAFQAELVRLEGIDELRAQARLN
jgi:hypothetical protein